MKRPRGFVPLLLSVTAKQSLVLFGALVACAISTVGQEPPKDVKGWGKVKWGMTIAQAKETYGSDAGLSDGKDGTSTRYVERLVINDFAVGDLAMKVSIETLPNSDLVKAVSLTPAHAPHTLMSAVAGASAYSYLKDSLTQKYGPPVDQGKDHSDHNGSKSTTWTFPSTVIKLLLVESGGADVSFLYLDYVATDTKALDAL